MQPLVIGAFAIFCLLAAGFSAIMLTLGVYSTLRHHARGRRLEASASGTLPPISLLKPIKGLEEGLEQNLESYFRQDYPGAFEIVFSAEELDDPGMHVARTVAARHPDVPTRFVASDPDFGLNPKVANLAGALAAASHDLVLQSDANTRAKPDYIRRIVSELLAEDASLLSSVVVGVGEESVGAAFENLHLTALIGTSTCTALHVAGVTCVIGKSMLFRRSELASLGGLRRVRSILCEDFILGRTYQEAGKRVVLSTTTIQNVNVANPVERFLSRHSRWLKMRAVIHFGSFVLDLFANPTAWALVAVVASGGHEVALIALGAALTFKLLVDGALLHISRGEPMKLRHLLLSPVKDLLIWGTWFYCLFSRSVTWRGRKLRFGKDSELREDDGVLPLRLARRLIAASR
jgi:ceramide glucosyltransferase